MSSTKCWTVIAVSIPSMDCLADSKLQWIGWPIVLQPKEKRTWVINPSPARVPALWEVSSIHRVVCVVQNSHRGTLTVTPLMEHRGRTSVRADFVQQPEMAGFTNPRDQLVLVSFLKQFWHAKMSSFSGVVLTLTNICKYISNDFLLNTITYFLILFSFGNKFCLIFYHQWMIWITPMRLKHSTVIQPAS